MQLKIDNMDYQAYAKSLSKKYRGKKISKAAIKAAKFLRKRTSLILIINKEKNISIECVKNIPIDYQLVFYDSDDYRTDPTVSMSNDGRINIGDPFSPDYLDYISGGVINEFGAGRAGSPDYSKPIESLGTFAIHGRMEEQEGDAIIQSLFVDQTDIHKLSNAYFFLQIWGKNSFPGKDFDFTEIKVSRI